MSENLWFLVTYTWVFLFRLLAPETRYILEFPAVMSLTIWPFISLSSVVRMDISYPLHACPCCIMERFLFVAVLVSIYVYDTPQSLWTRVELTSQKQTTFLRFIKHEYKMTSLMKWWRSSLKPKVQKMEGRNLSNKLKEGKRKKEAGPKFTDLSSRTLNRKEISNTI